MNNRLYYNVSLEEMQSVLTKEKGWTISITPKSREYFFEFPLSNSPHIKIMVASGITLNGDSRGRGKDAIRVYAVDTLNKQGYIRTKRVNRIQTWEKNLRNAVNDTFRQAIKRRNKTLTNER
jgi:hypothetical protein